MYNDNLFKLQRERDKIDDLLNNYQTYKPKDMIEWRILNENEEVDNLYVQNKTLFINEENMVLKGVDGSLEKWQIKKIYPIDKKDAKISELEEKIKELEMKLNEPTKSNGSIRKCNKSSSDDDGVVESEPETNG